MTAPTPTPRIIDCPGCGGTFTTTVETKLYCGQVCKVREKRRRERARRPAAPPPPRKAECVDCGQALKVAPLGSPPRRCAACRLLRASERALQRRRVEYAARAAVLQQDHERPRPFWARLAHRFNRRD